MVLLMAWVNMLSQFAEIDNDEKLSPLVHSFVFEGRIMRVELGDTEKSSKGTRFRIFK